MSSCVVFKKSSNSKCMRLKVYIMKKYNVRKKEGKKKMGKNEYPDFFFFYIIWLNFFNFIIFPLNFLMLITSLIT